MGRTLTVFHKPTLGIISSLATLLALSISHWPLWMTEVQVVRKHIQPLTVTDSVRKTKPLPLLPITVQLVNSETDTLISHANVSAVNEKNGQSFSVSSGSMGYTIPAPPGTTLVIKASALAYVTAQTRIVNLTTSQRVLIKLTHTKPSLLIIQAFATDIRQPLSPATARITSRITGQSERADLRNGRLERRFSQPDKLDIQVSSPGYTSVSQLLTIEVPPLGNRYEFDAALTKNSVEPAPASKSSNTASPSAVINQSFAGIEKGKSIRLSNVYFDQSSPVLRPESYAELDQLYTQLNQHPEVQIELRGFTDNQGDFDLNTHLSRERCQAVVAYLTGKGIAKTRLTAVGRGPLDPVAPNTNEENRRKNRRVEFIIR